MQSFASVESFTLGLSLDIAIPRLTPLKKYKELVLSVPANISFDIYKELGTALSFGIEVLPIGIEINKGLPFINLFFNKAGITIGYYGAFVYDTISTKLPNIVDPKTFKEVFIGATYVDYLLFSLGIDFIPVIGVLSESKITSVLDFYYYIQQNTYKVQLRIEFLY